MKNICCLLLGLLFLIGSLQNAGAQNIQSGDQNLKSVTQARSIALTNTLLSIGAGVGTVALFDNNTVQKMGAILGVYGIVAAPSTGNFYANDYPRGFAGMGARAIGAILMVDATREIFGQEFGDVLGVDDQKVSATNTKVLIGGAVVLGSIAYNVLSSKRSVKEFNHSEQQFSIRMKPAQVGDKIAPTLSANISF